MYIYKTVTKTQNFVHPVKGTKSEGKEGKCVQARPSEAIIFILFFYSFISPDIK